MAVFWWGFWAYFSATGLQICLKLRFPPQLVWTQRRWPRCRYVRPAWRSKTVDAGAFGFQVRLSFCSGYVEHDPGEYFKNQPHSGAVDWKIGWGYRVGHRGAACNVVWPTVHDSDRGMYPRIVVIFDHFLPTTKTAVAVGGARAGVAPYSESELESELVELSLCCAAFHSSNFRVTFLVTSLMFGCSRFSFFRSFFASFVHLVLPLPLQ